MIRISITITKTRLFPEELWHEMVLEGMIVEKTENKSQYNHYSFLESTDVTKPVKQIIRFSINAVQI